MKLKTASPIFALAFACCLVLGKPAHADLMLTGAQLYALQPITSFPTVGVTVSGSSLIFDPTSADYQKMFVLALSVAGSYSVSMNLTRLSSDHDPSLVIGNGTSMVGVAAFDQGGRSMIFDDGGSVGLNRQATTLFNGYAQPYPSIGGDFTMTANFSLANFGTQVGLSVLGSSATFDTSVALLPTSQLYVALVGENDPGEQYQLNWISISSGSFPSVPGPVVGTGLPGIVFALSGILVWWRRKRMQLAA